MHTGGQGAVHGYRIKEPLINQRNSAIAPQEYFLRMVAPSFRARHSAAISYYGTSNLEIAASLCSS
jgi:hypothetical protein